STLMRCERRQRWASWAEESTTLCLRIAPSKPRRTRSTHGTPATTACAAGTWLDGYGSLRPHKRPKWSPAGFGMVVTAPQLPNVRLEPVNESAKGGCGKKEIWVSGICSVI